MKPIDVKITRAEKRNRKIIIVFEPDLFSDEVFAVTPYYDEGERKNKLQYTNFFIKVKEQKGAIKAEIEYDITHYTTGHTQVHSLTSKFINKKDCALNWAATEEEKYLKEGADQVLNMWKDDPLFQEKLIQAIGKRKQEFKREKLKEAKEVFQKAAKNLEDALKDA